MAGRATLTTVPSRNAIEVPSTIASSSQRPLALAKRRSGGAVAVGVAASSGAPLVIANEPGWSSARAKWWRSGRLHEQVVGVAPQPILAALERLDNRMVHGVVVLGGVLVLGAVAAADVAAA